MLKKKRNRLRLIFIVLAVFAILLISANFIISGIAKSKITNYLDEKVPAYYTYELKRVHLDLFSLSLKIKKFALIPDTAYIDSLMASGVSKASFLELRVPSLIVRGFGALDAIEQKGVIVEDIDIFRPYVHFYSIGKLGSEGTSQTESDTTAAPDILQTIQLKLLELKEAELLWTDLETGEKHVHFKQTNLEIQELTINDILGKKQLQYHTHDVILDVKDQYYDLPGGWYAVRLGELSLSKLSRRLKIKDFFLEPKYEKEVFVEKFGKQTDVFRIGIPELNMYDILLDTLIHKRKLMCREMEILKLDMSVYRDKKIPRDTTIYPKLPQQILRNAKADLTIDTISIHEAFVKYEEVPAKKPKPGTLTIEALNITITGLTTNPRKIEQGATLQAYMTGKIMGKATFENTFVIPISKSNDEFRFFGRIGSVQAVAFNNMLKPSLGAEIKGGTIDEIVYDGLANNDFATGDFSMKYSNLEIEVNKKESDEGNKFVSWLANTVIKKDNPPEGKGVKTVDMYFERDKNKGFLNFYWKSLQSGIIKTLTPGGSQNKDKKMQHREKERLKAIEKEKKEDQKEKKKEKKKEEKQKKKDKK